MLLSESTSVVDESEVVESSDDESLEDDSDDESDDGELDVELSEELELEGGTGTLILTLRK